MEKEAIVKYLLRAVYLTLKTIGYPNVSLKKQDLLDYVPKIKQILESNGMLVTDLFVRTPVTETYDKYKDFLITILYGGNLGHFNESYDTIILDCSDFYIEKCQKELENYKEIICECCYSILDSMAFIDSDTTIETLLTYKSHGIEHVFVNCSNCANEYSKEPYACDGCNESYKRFRQKSFVIRKQ